jgi:hypothetical protein
VRLAVLTIGLALCACGCGGGNGSGEQGESSLRVTRQDGTKIELPEQVRAFCTQVVRNEGDPDEEPFRQLELWVLGGEFPPEREEEGQEVATLWTFHGAAKQLERTPQARLPTDQDLAALFIYDSETENELASDQGQSKGTIQVREWGCGKGDQVRLAIDVTLESEFFQAPTVEAVGEVEAVIGDPLPIPD